MLYTGQGHSLLLEQSPSTAHTTCTMLLQESGHWVQVVIDHMTEGAGKYGMVVVIDGGGGGDVFWVCVCACV